PRAPYQREKLVDQDRDQNDIQDRNDRDRRDVRPDLRRRHATLTSKIELAFILMQPRQIPAGLWFAALSRSHASTNSSPSQSRRQFIPSLKSRRILHQSTFRIEHQRVSAIQNRHRRKRLQARGLAIQRSAALQ